MPVYEYLCEACGKHQEHIRKFSDEPLTDCELCGAKGTLVKQISRSSFALKGSGWYTTDYKRAGKTESDAVKPNANTAADAPVATTTPATASAEKKTAEKPTVVASPTPPSSSESKS